MKIFLDPGHGGRDGGAYGPKNRAEKDDTLRLAFLVGKILKSLGHEVMMSRRADIHVGLTERTNDANRWKADYFCSIHRNSATPSANGVEVWLYHAYADKPKAGAVQVAKRINDNLVGVGFKNRGLKYGYRGSMKYDYAVNRQTHCMSSLVEVGFVTSEKDNFLFDKYFEKIARAIAYGIVGTKTENKPTEKIIEKKKERANFMKNKKYVITYELDGDLANAQALLNVLGSGAVLTKGPVEKGEGYKVIQIGGSKKDWSDIWLSGENRVGTLLSIAEYCRDKK